MRGLRVFIRLAPDMHLCDPTRQNNPHRAPVEHDMLFAKPSQAKPSQAKPNNICARALARVARAACATTFFLPCFLPAAPRCLASDGFFHSGALFMPTLPVTSVATRLSVTRSRLAITAALLWCCLGAKQLLLQRWVCERNGRRLCRRRI